MKINIGGDVLLEREGEIERNRFLRVEREEFGAICKFD